MQNSSYSTLYDIAENQAGFFSARQAEEINCSRKNLYVLVKGGKLKRVDWGIYRFTYYPSSPFEDLFIAILRAGDKSVISHETALSLYGLSDLLPGVIHIIIPKTHSRRRINIKFHIQKIEESEITRYQGLPITTVERTILDVLKSGVDALQVESAITEALERGLTTRERLKAQSKNKSHAVQKKLDQILERMVL
jgi:predicted transcriptional regulator of viral defense system